MAKIITKEQINESMHVIHQIHEFRFTLLTNTAAHLRIAFLSVHFATPIDSRSGWVRSSRSSPVMPLLSNTSTYASSLCARNHSLTCDQNRMKKEW